jgi:hypothetical protein
VNLKAPPEIRAALEVLPGSEPLRRPRLRVAKKTLEGAKPSAGRPPRCQSWPHFLDGHRHPLAAPCLNFTTDHFLVQILGEHERQSHSAGTNETADRSETLNRHNGIRGPDSAYVADDTNLACWRERLQLSLFIRYPARSGNCPLARCLVQPWCGGLVNKLNKTYDVNQLTQRGPFCIATQWSVLQCTWSNGSVYKDFGYRHGTDRRR